jgi:hypothetical protein
MGGERGKGCCEERVKGVVEVEEGRRKRVD